MPRINTYKLTFHMFSQFKRLASSLDFNIKTRSTRRNKIVNEVINSFDPNQMLYALKELDVSNSMILYLAVDKVSIDMNDGTQLIVTKPMLNKLNNFIEPNLYVTAFTDGIACVVGKFKQLHYNITSDTPKHLLKLKDFNLTADVILPGDTKATVELLKDDRDYNISYITERELELYYSDYLKQLAEF